MPYTLYKKGFVNESKMTVHDLREDMGRTYRYYKGEALAPFGFGLSYTNFSLSPQWPSAASMPTFVGTLLLCGAPLGCYDRCAIIDRMC